MSEQPAGSAVPQGAEVSLLDLALVVTRSLRLLILLSAVAGAVAFAVAGAWTSSGGSYTAAAKALLPPGAPPGETYVALLKSETVADRLVRRFNLAQSYGTSSAQQARAILAVRTRIATPGRVVMVSVDDANAQLASDLANGHVTEARDLARSFAITEAAQRRLYYERRVQHVSDELSRAKTRLQPERKGRGADGKLQPSEAALADLRARLTAHEIRIAALGGAESESVSAELGAFREQFSSLDHRGKRASQDVRYQEALLQLLLRQYELARLDEASTEIQLLDAATAADVAPPAGPRSLHGRAMIAIATVAATLAVCLVALFVREGWRREAATGGGARKLALIRESLRWRR